MTVQQLIDKLSNFDRNKKVVLVNLADDSGDRDKELEDSDIDDSLPDGIVIISHSGLND